MARKLITGNRRALMQKLISTIDQIRRDDYRTDQYNAAHPGGERHLFQSVDGYEATALDTLEERCLMLLNLVG